jgi:hypothetical protein
MKDDILDVLCLKRKQIEVPSTGEDECGQVCHFCHKIPNIRRTGKYATHKRS